MGIRELITSISLLDNFAGGWLPFSVISDSFVSDADNSSLICIGSLLIFISELQLLLLFPALLKLLGRRGTDNSISVLKAFVISLSVLSDRVFFRCVEG